MNILILSSRIPYPLTAGFRIRIFNVAKYFKNDCNHVDLLFMGKKEEYVKYNDELHEVFRNIYYVPLSKKEILFLSIMRINRSIAPFHRSMTFFLRHK